MDLFSAPIPAPARTPSPAADPFAPPGRSGGIAGDFSNLTFTPPRPPSPASAAAAKSSAPASAPVAAKDKYNGLVNLDFGGSGSGAPVRRQSLGLADHQHPPLNSMVGGRPVQAGGNGRPVSMAIPTGSNPYGSGNGYGNANGTQQAAVNPFAYASGNQTTQPSTNNGRRQSMGSVGMGGQHQSSPLAGSVQQKNSLDALNWKM